MKSGGNCGVLFLLSLMPEPGNIIDLVFQILYLHEATEN